MKKQTQPTGNGLFKALAGIIKNFVITEARKFNDRINGGKNLKGSFNLEIVDVRTGKILESYCDPNLVVNGGRAAVMELLGAATAGKRLAKLAVGTNGTAPAGGDTAITGAFVKSLGTVSYPTISSVRFDWTLLTSEANGINIVEFGLLCNDNTLFARKVRALIAKNSDIALNGYWIISF